MTFQSMSLVYRSETHLRSGEFEKAAATAERAAQMSLEYRQDAYHAWALWMLGEVSAHCADPNTEAAEARYYESIRSASELGMRPLIAHSYASLAKLYRGSGQRAESSAHFQTATTMYRDMGMTYWLEKAETETRQLSQG